MDKSLMKLVVKVLEINYENLIIESCEKVKTFAYDEKSGNWLSDDFTLFIKVKNKTHDIWNSTDVERCLFEHLGVTSIITV
jgi:hypothetical protein